MVQESIRLDRSWYTVETGPPLVLNARQLERLFWMLQKGERTRNQRRSLDKMMLASWAVKPRCQINKAQRDKDRRSEKRTEERVGNGRSCVSTIARLEIRPSISEGKGDEVELETWTQLHKTDSAQCGFSKLTICSVILGPISTLGSPTSYGPGDSMNIKHVPHHEYP